jgi:ATP-binding cassette, subfamily C (CFTR/MRP), member 1
MDLRPCVPTADRAFGPQVHGCRADFDFTLLFEESFLSIAPSSLFLAVVPFRLWHLYQQTIKADGKRLQVTKLVCLV